MPTPLPTGHRFWRRHKPTPEALRNLGATVAEFSLALLCVAIAVLLIWRLA